MKLSLFVVLSCVVAGCSAGSNAPKSDGQSSDIVAGETGEGGTCAGIAAIRCAKDLSCVIADEDRKYPDAAGVCTALSADNVTGGGTCGGIAEIKCGKAYYCAIAPEDRKYPDAAGVCTALPTVVGASCKDSLACAGDTHCDLKFGVTELTCVTN